MVDASAWNTQLYIGIVLASSWRARRGEAFANWVRSLLSVRPGIQPELLDLHQYRLPAYDELQSSSKDERRFLEQLIRRWSAKIDPLDGFVIVTPEYNQVYPGALKNALDHAPAAWAYKPVAFVSYEGAPAGVRAIEQLRAIAVAARMVPVRNAVNARVMATAAESVAESPDDVFVRAANAMIEQLLWWARITKAGRASLAPPPAQAEHR